MAETIKDKVEDINCDVDALAINIKDMLLSTVQEVLGCQKKKKQQKVMNDNRDLNDQRINLRGRSSKQTGSSFYAQRSELCHQ